MSAPAEVEAGTARHRGLGRPAALLGAIALAWAVLLFWLSSQSQPPVPEAVLFHDKLAHAGAYAVLGALLCAAARAARARPVRAVLLAVALASLYGVSDEWHQSFVPGRTCDTADWAADTTGALLGALAATVVLRRRGARASIDG